MKIYRVFHTLAGAAGNLVAIDLAGELPGEPLSSLPSGQGCNLPADITHCHLSHTDANRFLVNCYQRGRKIQCCGHGLLAAAHALLESTDQSRINLGQGISAQRSRSSDGKLETWLTMPVLLACSIDIPPWTSQLFSAEEGTDSFPVSAAATESDDGYLLLQMAAHFRLDRAVVDASIICASTARALLLWQHCPEDDNQIRMRYFAPQYGNPEDAATGSVLRVLAPYLQFTSGLEAFTVSQCSASGGRMSIQTMRDCVAITGNIQLIDTEDLPAGRQIPDSI